MKKKFVTVKKTKFFIVMTRSEHPIPYYGFTFWKKQMIARLKKEKRDLSEVLVVPVVFCEAQNAKEEEGGV